MIQITESSVPEDDAAQRMAQLLKMAQGNNSSHVAVLDMLVEQLSNVQHQLAIHTIVIIIWIISNFCKTRAWQYFYASQFQRVDPTPLRLDPLYVKVILRGWLEEFHTVALISVLLDIQQPYRQWPDPTLIIASPESENLL